MNTHVVVFTELGSGIGYGHVMRCQTLSKSLMKLKCSIIFCIYSSDDEVDRYNTGLTQQYESWHENEIIFNSLVTSDSIVIVDSYLAKSESYEYLSRVAKRVVALDDYNRVEYPVDCVLNPNIYFDAIRYGGGPAKFVGGADYCLLREEIVSAAHKIKVAPKLTRVLLTVGGSDIRKLLPTLIKLLGYHFPEIIFDCVAGTRMYQAEIKRSSDCYDNVRTYGRVSAAEMRSLMIAADIAITACGQTLGELTHLGVPMIGICVDIDQENFRDYYASKGLFNSKIDWDDDDLLNKVKNDIESLQAEQIRQTRAEALYSLIDGRGSVRSAKIILEDDK